ncbi:UvrD/REP helicase subfamily [Synechococcus sp. PCC 7335]|uniref:ATP-dependent helicase n=1 Tax=Synechococcus sp. (strain ATCC 29403 / PCC 7335) TaxID=91464 RepID=UPI00017EDFF3|nr:ATP-dependent helicase [Synechococcus sp. PCC 7335]EDX86820.1 UvrD/REP helicase subfamily [Synechococcus sp. PCC 7335]
MVVALPNSSDPAEIKAERDRHIRVLTDSLRPGQRALAQWRSGPLAVSAVPGSGKSTGMAAGAAIAIAHHQLHARKQLVLVTFTRSAAASLKAKVRKHLKDLRLPQNSFVVHTLHGLALNIATRHPEISNINLPSLDSDGTTLVSPTQSHRLIRMAVERWIEENPSMYQQLLEGQSFDGEEAERLRRLSVLRTEVLPGLAYTVIHEAKSSGLLPDALMEIAQRMTVRLEEDAVDYAVVVIAAGLYAHYQTLLSSQGLIDYDDMILAALKTLAEPDIRQLWQSRIFAIFEDEAQDSSPLQTQLLEALAGDAADPTRPLNLVRVGDPNQAINSTFTPADPVFFNQFCDACAQGESGGKLATIEQAGRSCDRIMAAANFVLSWVNRHSPSAPFRSQEILPVGPGDPQPDANPAPIGGGVEIVRPKTVINSVQQLAKRISAIYQENSELTMAVLVRESRQGKFVREILEDPERLGFDFGETGIELYDVGERDRQNHVPREMLTLLQFIERPHSPDNIKAALRVLVSRQLIPTQDLNSLATNPEQFLYPGPLDEPPDDSAARKARRYCAALIRARLELPAYHLIPFLGLTLQYNQSELATADKLAARIAQQTLEDSTLSAMLGALQELLGSESFRAIEAENAELQYAQPGRLTIMTMHKAKGLDWDVVCLPFLHKRNIPGESWVPPQTQFLGKFSLDEVARAQLRTYTHGVYAQDRKPAPIPNIEDAWQQATNLKRAEEFRLLYVAMTRAKKLLWISAAKQAPFTWSKPSSLQDAEMSPVITALAQTSSAVA